MTTATEVQQRGDVGLDELARTAYEAYQESLKSAISSTAFPTWEQALRNVPAVGEAWAMAALAVRDELVRRQHGAVAEAATANRFLAIHAVTGEVFTRERRPLVGAREDWAELVAGGHVAALVPCPTLLFGEAPALDETGDIVGRLVRQAALADRAAEIITRLLDGAPAELDGRAWLAEHRDTVGGDH
jgi:hypothetical protein